jgi:hypothetical protein
LRPNSVVIIFDNSVGVALLVKVAFHIGEEQHSD